MTPVPTPTATYAGYLRLGELLDQQRPRSRPPVHDELLFITVHQVHELWLKLLLVELGDARDQLMAGRAHGAGERLRRGVAIGRLLVDQLDVLDTMHPRDFRRFRDDLGSASGIQSVQSHEVELLSGARDRAALRLPGLDGPDRARLERRLAEPSLWDGFRCTLAAAGFDRPGPAGLAADLEAIAGDRERHGALDALADLLLAHDRTWAMWRARHVLMCERMIGSGEGTGGSRGVAYLRSRLHVRFFPQLWAHR